MQRPFPHCERPPSWRSPLGTALITGNSIISLGRTKIPLSRSDFYHSSDPMGLVEDQACAPEDEEKHTLIRRECGSSCVSMTVFRNKQKRKRCNSPKISS